MNEEGAAFHRRLRWFDRQATTAREMSKLQNSPAFKRWQSHMLREGRLMVTPSKDFSGQQELQQEPDTYFS